MDVDNSDSNIIEPECLSSLSISIQDPSMDKRGIGYPLQVNDKPSQPPVSFDDDLEGEEIRLHVSRHVMTEGETSEGNSVASSYG